MTYPCPGTCGCGAECIEDAANHLVVGGEPLHRCDVHWPNETPPASPIPTLAEVEKAHIRLVLEHHKGNMSRAARTLGIDRRTLYRKVRTYGWRIERTREIIIEGP